MEPEHKLLQKDRMRRACTKEAQDQIVAYVVCVYPAVKSHKRAKLSIKELLKLLLLLINTYSHSAQVKETPNVYIRTCRLKAEAQFFFHRTAVSGQNAGQRVCSEVFPSWWEYGGVIFIV